MDVVVGRIGRAHGIRGEVSIALRTDDPESRFTVGAVLRAEPSSHRVLTVAAARAHAGRLLVRFEEIPDRTAAESLRGATLVVEVADTDRPADPDEFYDHQLIGLDVRTSPESASLGTVADVMHLPAQDLLSVRTRDDQDVLVPFVAAIVPEVDVRGGWIRVAELPGLFDPDAAE